MGKWLVDVISFQKIFSFCGLKSHIVEIRRDVTLVDNGQTDNGRMDGRTTDGQNLKVELEFWKQNSQSVL